MAKGLLAQVCNDMICLLLMLNLILILSFCNCSAGWIDCWSVSIVAIKINWIYHLIPPLGPDPQADITTPEKEEILLSPIRMPKIKSPALKWVQTDSAQFDPNTLPSDKVNVEIEIGSSVLFAYGTILRNFINLKVSSMQLKWCLLRK